MHIRTPNALRCALTAGAVALVVPAPGSLHAQETAVRPGDWVRIARPEGQPTIRGEVLAADSAVLTIRPAKQPEIALQLRSADVRAVDVRVGRASAGEGAWRGARVGATVGILTGLAVTGYTLLSDADESCHDCFIPATAVAAAGSVVFTVLTTTAGAIVGATHPPETWRRAGLPLRIGVVPRRGPGGAGLALVLRW